MTNTAHLRGSPHVETLVLKSTLLDIGDFKQNTNDRDYRAVVRCEKIDPVM